MFSDFKKRYLVSILLLLFLLPLSGCSSMPVAQRKGYAGPHLKRIPYKREGKYRVTTLFYASTRKTKGTPDSTKYFLPELADKMNYGSVDVRIDPRLSIGKMLPHWYKKKGVIGVKDINAMDHNIFIKKLSEDVKDSPHKSILVMVRGYKDDFEYTAIKAAYFAYILDVNTSVLLFDWPGDQPLSIAGYVKARSLAEKSGPYMGQLLADVIRKVKPDKIWVESASLGCQVVCNAFEYMYKDPDLRDPQAEIKHVIMAAPDVYEEEFNQQFGHEIAALTENMTTYVSSGDQALLLSELIDGKRKLGREHITGKKRRSLQDEYEEAKDMLYIKSLHPDKVSLVDVTPINTASYRHGYYLEAPEYFDDFYIRILGKSPGTNRRRYLLKVNKGVDYWVLKSGKR